MLLTIFIMKDLKNNFVDIKFFSNLKWTILYTSVKINLREPYYKVNFIKEPRKHYNFNEFDYTII